MSSSKLMRAEPAAFTLNLSSEKYGLLAKDRVRVNVPHVNLLVDSLNTYGFGTPADSDEIEAIEDDEDEPGKILLVNDADIDMDSIPDYADGYDLLPADTHDNATAGERFVPVVFTISDGIDPTRASVRVTYPASDPGAVTTNGSGGYTLPSGTLRLWKRDGGDGTRSTNTVANGGDFLPTTTACTAAQFGFGSGLRTVTYYAEAVRSSAEVADIRILFEVDPDGDVINRPTPGFIAADAVRLTAVRLGMTPDFDRDGKIDDEDKRLLLAKKQFRVWINDDRDEGYWGLHPQEDSPDNSYNHIPNSAWWKPFTWFSSYIGERKMNYDDAKVNGVRDMVDFFAIGLDLPFSLLGTNGYTYSLVHGGTAVNIAYTPLAPGAVSDFLRTTNKFALYGAKRDEQADEAKTYTVTPQGLTLDDGWLAEAATAGRDPVLVMEGRAESMDQRMWIELRKGDVLIGKHALGLSVSPVKKMFRYLNVRKCHPFFDDHHKPSWPSSSRASVEGKWTTDLDSPPNNPDGFFLDSGESLKTLVCVHGLDWDHDETPAGHAEIFKRLFQSGSNARYVGVSWASDMSRRLTGDPLAYGSDVIGAFLAAPYVTEQLESAAVGLTGANTTVLAHSLGNVLVSSAIADHGLSVGNYVMLNPAVPLESYDGRAAAKDQNMVHPHWRASTNVYAERLMCAAWSGLFSTNDPRSSLTWDKRFASTLTRTRAYQFYSTGEEVLRQSDGVVPPVGALRKLLAVSLNWLPFVDISVDGTVVTGERVWVYNEMTKGQPGFADQIFVGNHNHAGWRFNTDYDVQETYYDEYNNPRYVDVRMPVTQADGLATTNLIANPFFDPFQNDADADIPGWPAAVGTLYTNDGANATFPLLPLSTATTNQILWHAKLLAEAIPPLSGPAGSMPVGKILNNECSFNMMDAPYRDTTLWPATRPRKSNEQQSQRRWLHGDYKDAPYLLTHGLYLKIAEIEKQ